MIRQIAPGEVAFLAYALAGRLGPAVVLPFGAPWSPMHPVAYWRARLLAVLYRRLDG